jgi:hypothetical protein
VTSPQIDKTTEGEYCLLRKLPDGHLCSVAASLAALSGGITKSRREQTLRRTRSSCCEVSLSFDQPARSHVKSVASHPTLLLLAPPKLSMLARRLTTRYSEHSTRTIVVHSWRAAELGVILVEPIARAAEHAQKRDAPDRPPTSRSS